MTPAAPLTTPLTDTTTPGHPHAPHGPSHPQRATPLTTPLTTLTAQDPHALSPFFTRGERGNHCPRSDTKVLDAKSAEQRATARGRRSLDVQACRA